MRVLIAEDDRTSRIMITRMLAPYADCTVVVNGNEAVSLFSTALELNRPYDLICLDVLMPELDGLAVLTRMRGLENDLEIKDPNRARVIMTTALADLENIKRAIRGNCQGYLLKPINRLALLEKLKSLGLISNGQPLESEDAVSVLSGDGAAAAAAGSDADTKGDH
jgi:two-component system, chemotaxis family, chemotaxis protein CheY